MTLSVVIITKNEEENIERCLEQVKWADEIIVVDAFSQDRTVAIAKKYTDKVISHEWHGFVNQRAFALGLATSEVVLILDADEIIDKKAQDEIKNILSSKEMVSDGYRIRCDVYFLGRRLFFSQRPSLPKRLFRRDKGFIVNKFMDEYYDVSGHTKLLCGSIMHYTSRSIAERIKKINRYSTLWAAEQAKYRAKQPRLSKMVYVPIKSFIGNFFIRGGFLDDFPGFIWCSLKALENFLKYVKLYYSFAQKAR